MQVLELEPMEEKKTMEMKIPAPTLEQGLVEQEQVERVELVELGAILSLLWLLILTLL